MASEITDVREMTGRIERLERANRRLVRAGLVALVLACGIAAMAQAWQGERTVEAQNFVVRDMNGKIRASLDVPQDGRLGLWLRDAQGRPRAVLGVQPDGTPGLVLFDEAGKQRAGLALNLDGSPGLKLFDGAGKTTYSAP